MRFPLLFTITLSILTTTAYAETREERLAAAQEYVAITMETFDLEKMVDTMWQPVVAQLEAKGMTVTQEQKDALRDLYRKEFGPYLQELMYAQDQIMADIFTLEEIQYAIEVYSSPVGRSMMTKMPEIIAAQQPQIMEAVQQRMPEIMPQILSILKLEN